MVDVEDVKARAAVAAVVWGVVLMDVQLHAHLVTVAAVAAIAAVAAVAGHVVIGAAVAAVAAVAADLAVVAVRELVREPVKILVQEFVLGLDDILVPLGLVLVILDDTRAPLGPTLAS